ncbi:HsdM family class I SAM-dependent methyltransferase [Haliscomenobacter hydrossis]|uniref:site-specific DNA-methyltransferase (adenine-specific) n=1 Tax=Haliscomenobacter hydrossis (strain ATCC 27775 / DSM 1100 / LMG 10767 / O) TaxID=760192 RepID=F4KS00_HALH1|nr:N-6 DNA methylase [Haliscomenobacter hydrossis]AEE51087.1 N-6 DNA methylase [Haliscomenobacter hydrossis DSM 1100]
MNNAIFTYLKSYSTDPFKVDRLIISAFLYSLDLQNTGNQFLQQYIIQKEDDDNQNLKEFLSIHLFTEIEELIRVFEFVISPEDKILTGAIYTPKNIRDYIFEQCFEHTDDLNNVKICDPACGCGGFLYTAAKTIHDQTGKSYQTIFVDNIYGLDVQMYAINRSKLLLTLLGLTEGENADFEFNLDLGNALNFKWAGHYPNFQGFDIVVGNPPYVCSRNIDDESKELIFDWKVSESGHPDLYIPFFQIGIENLRPQGVLGFITMNTFFKSVNGRALRQYFEDQALALKILDFGGNQVFQNKSTYTCICIIRKCESQTVEYAQGNEESLTENVPFQRISYKRLNHKNGWNLQQNDLLNRIEEAGPAFGDLYRTRNGIATLMNHIYIFDGAREDEEFYYLQNGAEYPIEKGICKEIINPNKFTQAKCIDELRQKAIFPYEFDAEGAARLISQEDFKDRYPCAYRYMEAKKDVLAKRDKGKGKYENWYAYGRNQSLEKYSNKLFFPHITPHIPHYTISQEEDLLFYNGIAVVSEDEKELHFLKKLMSSDLFWFYVVNSSKPYGSGFFSLSRNYIKNFGIAEFAEDEKREFIESNQDQANEILADKYKVALPFSKLKVMLTETLSF